MEDTEDKEMKAEKMFLGFGIATVLSGIYLLFDGQYLIGGSGGSVGLWLVAENWKKIRSRSEG